MEDKAAITETETTDDNPVMETNVEEGQSAEEAPLDNPDKGETEEEMALEQIQKSKHYKELQRSFSEKSAKLKEFEKQFEEIGGMETALSVAKELRQNQRFAEFVKQEQMRKKGIDLDALPEDAKQAIQLVKTLISEEVAPLRERYRNEALQSHFSKMEGEYGETFNELRPAMAELAQNIPQELQENPSFEMIEGLYLQALKKSGRFEEFAAKQYEKRLKDKQAKASAKPKPNPKGNTTRTINSFEDAARAAREILAS